MAALLRFGAARACRLLATYTRRNASIYQRNSPAFHKEHILKAILPSVNASRFLSNESSASEAVESQIAEDETENLGRNFSRRDRQRSGGQINYERNLRQLGTIMVRRALLKTFQEILRREGKLTSLQAYQTLRNCGTDLVHERPERRIELAHNFWDRIVETGFEPDVMLYNALLSVYIQNNHNFNPLEVLEQMESKQVEPNRTTLLLLMQGYAQKGDVAGAFKILEFIKAAEMPLTEQVFAALVTAYGVNGDPESARGVFDLMRENGLEPDIDSYSALLVVYGEEGNMDAIMKTIDEMQEKHVYPNKKVFLALLNAASKRGHTSLIKELLQKPIVKTLIEGSLKELLSTVATRGEINTAFLLLGHMSEGVTSQGQAYRTEAALLKHVIMSKQPLDVVMVTIRELDKLGVFRNVYEDALDLCFAAGASDVCFVILQEMFQKELRVRNHYFYPLMATYARKKDARAAQDVVNLMGENGMQPDENILRYLVQSYGSPDANDVEAFMTFSQALPVSKVVLTSMAQLVMTTGQLDKLEKTIEFAKQQEGIQLSCITNAFKNYLEKRNFDPRNGVKILEILDKNECTFGLVSKIAITFQESTNDRVKDNAKLVSLVLEAGLGHLLDSRAYTFVMTRLRQLNMSEEFYDFVRTMKEHGVELDVHHYRQLLKMMGFDGKAEAAQFCFDKFKQLEEPQEREYSYLILAYANCPEGGIFSFDPRERNMKRICQLFNAMWTKGFTLTNRAKGAACIAHILTHQLDKAEEIRSIHGIGEPKFLVLSKFMRGYSRRGDVAKTLEYFEALKKIDNTKPALPPFIYNNLIHLYGFHGDTESQRKVFEEMKENNVTPNDHTYSELLQTYLRKDDIDTALKLFQDAKEQGLFIRDSTCLLLLNAMARSGQTEHFESALEDIIANKVTAPQNVRQAHGLLRGLVFCCVHAGKKDLALKLQLEHEVSLESPAFVRYADNSALRGEVNAVLNMIEFLKENNCSHTGMYLPLAKAYDAKQDIDSVKAVYNKMVEDGVEIDDSFLTHYNHILMKYNAGEIPLSGQTESATETQTVRDESDSSSSDAEGDHSSLSDEEKDHSEEIEKDEELNDLK